MTEVELVDGWEITFDGEFWRASLTRATVTLDRRGFVVQSVGSTITVPRAVFDRLRALEAKGGDGGK